jgi:hypothetical protein
MEFYMAMEDYCSKTWEQVQHLSVDQQNLVLACFRSNYIYTILVDAYHFDNSTWKNITFQNNVDGSDLGWILGMMINTTNVIPGQAPSGSSISIVAFVLLLSLFVIFVFLAIGFAYYGKKVRKGNVPYSELPSQATPSGYGYLQDREPL